MPTNKLKIEKELALPNLMDEKQRNANIVYSAFGG
jgi:hypothetical protein